LPQSGDQAAMLALPTAPAPTGTLGATTEPGVYEFAVVNGNVVPPAPTGLALDIASDSGVVGDDDTNVTTPVLTGLGQAGDTVRLFDGTAPVGSGTVLGDGSWAVTAAPLADGVHLLTARQSSGAGAVSAASAALALTIDTSAPVTTPRSLSVPANAAATPIGIAAPSDANDPASALSVTVTALPGNGVVTLGDGTTAVTAGEQLTVAQLTGLDFTPGAGAAGSSGSFAYSVSDAAGNSGAGSASLSVAVTAATLFDFIFTYADGADYYQGTVADGGGFGYRAGQTFASGLGQYQILGTAGTTSEASGTVSVSNYSHGGPGAASPVPVATAAGQPDGSNGLGSEQDAVRGTDGQTHPFSSTQEASFTTTPLFGFVFTYNDGEAFYSGTVAGPSPSLPSSPLGTYSLFAEGVTTRAAGTVVVDRFTVGAAAFIPNHASAAAVDGSGGLGSEQGSVTINGQALSFSDTLEPRVTLSVPTLPATPPPAAADVITAELNQIYTDELGRAPDPAGLATYTALLAGGGSTTEVRQIIAASAETQTDLNLLYRQVFGRDIDPSGQATYTGFLGDGVSLATIELILAQSPEAQADLGQLYQEVLGRAADGGGLVTYSGLLANGYGIGTVRDILAHSPEAANDLGRLLQSGLGRAPDAAELVGAEDRLAAGDSQASLASTLGATGSAGGFSTIIASTGAAGFTAAPDTPTVFNFDDISFTNDTIAGFDPTQDAIRLPPSLAATVAAVQADTTPFNGGSLITLDATHSIFLAGLAPAALTQANFTIA
jgi:Bacterial Ig-like domain